MPEVDLGADAEGIVADAKVHAATSLDREVVDAADPAVMESDKHLPERQNAGIHVGADAQTAHRRDDRAAAEMIDPHLAHRPDEGVSALERAGDVEVAADVTGLTRLVVNEVVVRAEIREV